MDAYFTKKSFIDRITTKTHLEIICLLRQDANLRYLYTGPKRAGKEAPKLYDGKINLKKPDLSRFDLVQESATERLYSALVNCVFLKRTVRLAYVQQLNSKGEVQSYRPYFSTDLTLSAVQLVGYYRLRYHRTAEAAGVSNPRSEPGRRFGSSRVCRSARLVRSTSLSFTPTWLSQR
ncbi:MAG: hypothetical protein LH609_08440 [Rudanella sp.]|nr:hypothetical protein [Rudanella sp.]